MTRDDLEKVLALAWETDDRTEAETRALAEVSGWLNDISGADKSWPEYVRAPELFDTSPFTVAKDVETEIV